MSSRFSRLLETRKPTGVAVEDSIIRDSIVNRPFTQRKQLRSKVGINKQNLCSRN